MTNPQTPPVPKISARALQEVEDAVTRYSNEVEASALTLNSKETYLLHAENFVRWLKDDFEPGKTKEQTEQKHRHVRDVLGRARL